MLEFLQVLLTIGAFVFGLCVLALLAGLAVATVQIVANAVGHRAGRMAATRRGVAMTQ